MNTIMYFLLGIGYVVLFIWGMFLSRKNGFLDLTNVLLLVIVALIYDNIIIALGKFIGEGNMLKNLTYVRYLLHALGTPTLILFNWSICNKLGLRWAKKTSWKVIFGLLTIGIILYELLTSVKGLELRPKWEDGLLTYERIGSSSPLMVALVTLVTIIVGIILIKKFHFPWLFIGTLIMLCGGLLTIWIKHFPIMNVLEFIFILSFLITLKFQVQYQRGK